MDYLFAVTAFLLGMISMILQIYDGPIRGYVHVVSGVVSIGSGMGLVPREVSISIFVIFLGLFMNHWMFKEPILREEESKEFTLKEWIMFRQIFSLTIIASMSIFGPGYKESIRSILTIILTIVVVALTMGIFYVIFMGNYNEIMNTFRESTGVDIEPVFGFIKKMVFRNVAVVVETQSQSNQEYK